MGVSLSNVASKTSFEALGDRFCLGKKENLQ